MPYVKVLDPKQGIEVGTFQQVSDLRAQRWVELGRAALPNEAEEKALADLKDKPKNVKLKYSQDGKKAEVTKQTTAEVTK